MNKTKAIKEMRKIFRRHRREGDIDRRKSDLNRRETDIDRRTEARRDKKRGREQFQGGDHHARHCRVNTAPEPSLNTEPKPSLNTEPKPSLYRLSAPGPPILKQLAIAAVVFLLTFLVVLLLMFLYEQHTVYHLDNQLIGRAPGAMDSPGDTPPPRPGTNPYLPR